jgi:hypothetical protein
MPSTFPRLPDPPAPDPAGESAVSYGCRILYFLLSTDVYCTCSDDQLLAADHASHVAVTAPGILPRAVDRLSRVRHEIAATLRVRVQLAAEQAQYSPAPASCTPAGGANGDGWQDGPTDPSGRVPRRPYPFGPAAGDAIDPGAELRIPATLIQF